MGKKQRGEAMTDAAREAVEGLQAGIDAASKVVDQITERWHESAEPQIEELTDRASEVAQRGQRWVRRAVRPVSRRLSAVSDRLIAQVEDAPLRSLVLVVGAGALVYAAVRVMGQRSR